MTTWWNLVSLQPSAGISIYDCFFTYYFIGVHTGGGTTG